MALRASRRRQRSYGDVAYNNLLDLTLTRVRGCWIFYEMKYRKCLQQIIAWVIQNMFSFTNKTIHSQHSSYHTASTLLSQIKYQLRIDVNLLMNLANFLGRVSDCSDFFVLISPVSFYYYRKHKIEQNRTLKTSRDNINKGENLMKEKGTLKTDNGSLLKKLLRDFG